MLKNLIIIFTLFSSTVNSAGTEKSEKSYNKSSEKSSDNSKEYILKSDNSLGNDNEVFEDALKLIRSKDYEKAISKLNLLVNSSSSEFSKADVYNELGFAYRKSNDFDNASIFYNKALKEDPKHLGAIEYQGEMFVDLGQKDKAIANLNKLRNLVGEDDSYYKELDSYISKN